MTATDDLSVLPQQTPLCEGTAVPVASGVLDSCRYQTTARRLLLSVPVAMMKRVQRYGRLVCYISASPTPTYMNKGRDSSVSLPTNGPTHLLVSTGVRTVMDSANRYMFLSQMNNRAPSRFKSHRAGGGLRLLVGSVA